MLRAIALCVSLLAAPALADDAPRPPVSDFGLRALGGERVKLSGHAGKVVLVAFWATWCNPCKQELAFLDELAKKYADHGLVVLAINTDAPKSQAEVRRFVNARGLSLPVLLDPEGEVAGRLNPRASMPFTIYVDRAGRRAYEHEGFTPDEPAKIEARVAALLKEAAPR